MTSAAVPAKRAKPCPIVRPPCGAKAITTCAEPPVEIHERNAIKGRDGGTLLGVPFNQEIHMTDKLLMQKDGAIGWIIFNQPEKRNAVSQDMWDAMPGYVKELSSDDAIRVVVLRGAGDQAFVS